MYTVKIPSSHINEFHRRREEAKKEGKRLPILRQVKEAFLQYLGIDEHGKKLKR